MSVHIHFACNNERGEDTGHFEQAEVYDAPSSSHPRHVLSLEGPVRVVRFLATNRLRLGRRVFCIVGHGSWVGNVFWEEARLRPADGLAAVAYMLESMGFRASGWADEMPWKELAEGGGQ